MLSNEQVLALTRRQPELLGRIVVGNKTVFQVLYPYHGNWGPLTKERLKKLTVDDFSSICPLLLEHHWKDLSEQMKTEITENHQDFFDRSKVAFEALYPAHASKDTERYERISFEALMQISRRFEAGHWIQLSDKLVKKITEEKTETLKIVAGRKTVFTLFYPVDIITSTTKLGKTPLENKIQEFSPKIVAQ